MLPFLLFSALSIFSVIILLFRKSKIYEFELITYIILAPIILIILPIATLIIASQLEVKSSNIALVLISMIINFCFIISLSTFNEIKKVKDYNYYSRIVVEFEDKIITSNNDFYYIGKTKLFIFFYSALDKTSIAYSSNKLKSIKYAFNN